MIFTISCTINEPVHEILVLLAYAQKPPSNAYADITSIARYLKFGPSFHLHPYLKYVHLHPTFEYASSECSCKSAQLPVVTCHLLMTFANSLNPDQDRQNVVKTPVTPGGRFHCIATGLFNFPERCENARKS